LKQKEDMGNVHKSLPGMPVSGKAWKINDG